MTRRVLLIVNPAAGGGRAAQRLPGAEAALRRLGVDFETARTTSLEHARELARTAARTGAVAATLSGDGLVGAVAGELTGTEGVLGVLPGGRGNDFARVLGIPEDVEAACAIVAGGAERLIDVGEVDGRPFIGIASAGFDSEANRVANETKLIRGDLVYAYGALRALLAWKPARFTLDLDGRETIAYSGYSIACANSKAYGGGMYLAPDAELDDGRLDVVCTGLGTKRRALYNLPKLFKGRHLESPGMHVRRAAEVRVSADRPFVVFADGDPIGELPVTVGVRHRALRVLAPPG